MGAENKLEQFYAALRPRWFDLLAHITFAESFIVDGDALIADCLDSPRRDSSSAQPLQLAYLCEQVLDGLAARGASFNVVFFKDNESLWYSKPWLRAFRRAFISHLKSTDRPSMQVIDTFNAFTSDEWTEYLRETRPAFLLTGDLPVSPGVDDEKAWHRSAQKLFRAEAVHALTSSTRVAYLSELEFKDNKAFSFLTIARVAWQANTGDEGASENSNVGRRGNDESNEASKGASHFVYGLQNTIVEAIMPEPPSADGIKTFADGAIHSLSSMANEDAPTWSSEMARNDTLSNFSSEKRLYLTARALSMISQEHEAFTLKVIALAESLLDLPLSIRSVKCSGDSSNPMWSALVGAEKAFLSVLGRAPLDDLTFSDSEPKGIELVDFVDTRLIRAIGSLFLIEEFSLESLSLPEGISSRAQKCWEKVVDMNGWDVKSNPFMPILTSRGAKAMGPVGLQNQGNECPKADPLLPVEGNELVEAMFGEEKGMGIPLASTSELAKVRRESNALEERFQWERAEKLLPAYWSQGKDSDAGKYAQAKSLTLSELAFNSALNKGQRRRVRTELSKIEALRADKQSEPLHKLRRDVNKYITTNEQKGQQKHARYLQWYAASLSGTKFTRGRTITHEKDAASKKKQQHHSKKAESKKDAIIRQQEEAKKPKEKENERERWANIQARLASTHKESEWTDGAAMEVNQFIKDTSVAEAALDALMYLLDRCYEQHKACDEQRRAASKRKELPPEHSMRMAMHMWEGITASTSRFLEVLCDDDRSKKANRAITKTLEKLGFPEASAGLRDRIESIRNAADEASTEAGEEQKGEQKNSKRQPSSAKKHSGKSSARGGREEEKASKKEEASASEQRAQREPDRRANCYMSAARFEMVYCGHLLPRPKPEKRDQRAESFTPDTWQSNVLDCIDNGTSAVVCAPTSSGKTFISSYVMESVLRATTEGRCVFLAPTKALVNQVAAQVYKDFGNEYGIFLRDFKQNALQARVLITVPACLEALLMSPQFQEWAKTLKFVIFDEIHCIGDEEGGEVWEHLLLLLRCPFLALSATVGNPNEFTDWLRGAKKLQMQQDRSKNIKVSEDKYDVRLVTHNERYADLRSHVFVPAREGKSFGLESGVLVNRRGVQEGKLESARNHACDHVRELHPASALTARLLRDYGFPSELPLEPRDSVFLYDTIQDKCKGEEEMLSGLDPQEFFRGKFRITRPDARKYERALQNVLVTWARGTERQRQWLEDSLSQMRRGLHEATKVAETELGTNIEYGKGEEVGEPFLDLLVALGASDRLPALIFNFDRFVCVELLEQAVERLERLEDEYNEKHAKEMDAKEAILKKQQKLAAKQRERNKSEEENEPEFEEGPAKEEEGPVNKWFTFVREGEHVVKAELDSLMNSLRLPEDSIFVRGLYRGIGVHHPGLNKKYRQAVEILFRAKHLKVVISTSTLAYGINMPCRSVVFAGDSIHFDALHFRQMSGRAGRRGFDQLGHIVFFGVPGYKIARLLVSPVPYLRGRHPTSATLSLRSLLLHEACPEARDALLCLFQRPHIGHENPEILPQLQHLFRHCLELLQRRHLLNAAGEGNNLAPLACHIYWCEPANLAFTALIDSGLLHQISTPSNDRDGNRLKLENHRTRENITDDLMLVLANVFQREPLRHPTKEDARIHACPSQVILQEPSKQFKEVVDKLNDQILRPFINHCLLYSQNFHAHLPSSTTLPFSKLSHRSEDLGSVGERGIVGILHERAQKFTAASPYMAMGGKGDRFGTKQELYWSSRSGLKLQVANIPTLDCNDRHGRMLMLNSHLIDYKRHERKGLLTTMNGVPEGVAWESLYNFSGIAKALSSALNKMAPSGENEDEEFVSQEGPADALNKVASRCQDLLDGFNVK